VAKPPAAECALALRMDAVQAIETLAARCDGAGDDPLPDVIEVLEPCAELLNDTDRFVPDDEARPYGVLAAHDMDISATNRRRRDAEHGFAGFGRWFRHFFNRDVVFASEDHGFHRVHFNIRLRRDSACAAASIEQSQCRWRR